ncbi:MAG TPA: alpha/beta fold hydrolase [Kiloniellaceae bacterium]|nr:alpha/beta fold hydrolase [Kiloniellaceae bacterium]
MACRGGRRGEERRTAVRHRDRQGGHGGREPRQRAAPSHSRRGRQRGRHRQGHRLDLRARRGGRSAAGRPQREPDAGSARQRGGRRYDGTAVYRACPPRLSGLSGEAAGHPGGAAPGARERSGPCGDRRVRPRGADRARRCGKSAAPSARHAAPHDVRLAAGRRPARGAPRRRRQRSAAGHDPWLRRRLRRLAEVGSLPAGRPARGEDRPARHGRSPRRPVESFRSLARMVVEAFDAEGLEDVHLVGHSLGAALALALADVRPRRMAALTMIAPAGLGPEMNGAVLSGLARAGRKESLAPWLKQLTAEPQIVTESFVMAAMQARKDPALRAYQQDLAETLFPDSVQSFDLTPALDRLAVPAQIVWGRKDRVFPWKQALQAPGRVALHLLHDIGHMPHLEAPEEVAAVIGGRLKPAVGQPATTPV